MENGAKGVEVIISGKLRAQRAKAMKFRPRSCSVVGKYRKPTISGVGVLGAVCCNYLILVVVQASE